MKAAMRLHRNTGHRLPRAMIKVPRRGGATAVTIAAAKQIKRSSCFENQAPKPRSAAVLEPARDLGQVVGVDAQACRQRRRHQADVTGDRRRGEQAHAR
eukprot:54226-Pyramimonas_sp.AAC.1